MYQLDTFQEQSLESITIGNNVFVTAPTGSGKTVCAMQGIMKAISEGKRVIYTSPIKSLSNQKYAEFKKKLKETNTSIGIITGDIKESLDAQLLIMTAEILHNLLHVKNEKGVNHYYDLHIDIEKEVGCVIMDEIHFINDKDRGHVWENTLLMMPSHITLVLLSATLSNDTEFTNWLSKIKGKPCDLIKKIERVVPLTHYMYNYAQVGKEHKDKDIMKKITIGSNKLITLMDQYNVFNEV